VFYFQSGIISGKITKSDGTTAISGALVEVLNLVLSNQMQQVIQVELFNNNCDRYVCVRVSSTGYQSQMKTVIL